MRVVVAMDSFKGSLTSLQAAQAVKDGILNVIPSAEVCVLPLADGGEGTVQALSHGLGGSVISTPVTGPLGNSVVAEYCILQNSTAIIEAASASGLPLIPPVQRDPMFTTTYGVGELILHAIKEGCRNFIIGIGGSGTNDGGIGMLTALGYQFLDSKGSHVPFGAVGLKNIAAIKTDHVIPELKDCCFRVACDVSNPLIGPNGSSMVFSPQKGASKDAVLQMEQWMTNYADLTKSYFPMADPFSPGAGAAGGLGFAFSTFLDASLEPGAKIIADTTDLDARIQASDLVVTGEGRLDGQSIMGKAPIYVAQLGKKHGKKVIAFAGSVGKDATICNSHGIHAYFSVVPGIITLEDAMDPLQAIVNIRSTVEQVFRLLL